MPLETVQTLTTQRLVLRPFVQDDRSALLALQMDPIVMRYYGNGQPLTEAQSDVVLDYHINCREYPYWAWAITLHPPHHACFGQITAGTVEWRNEQWIEFGYLLIPSMWGHGYATEALTTTLHHGIQTLGWKRIMAGANPQNTQSHRVMQKAGLHFNCQELNSHGTPRHVYTLQVDTDKKEAPVSPEASSNSQ